GWTVSGASGIGFFCAGSLSLPPPRPSSGPGGNGFSSSALWPRTSGVGRPRVKRVSEPVASAGRCAVSGTGWLRLIALALDWGAAGRHWTSWAKDGQGTKPSARHSPLLSRAFMMLLRGTGYRATPRVFVPGRSHSPIGHDRSAGHD